MRMVSGRVSVTPMACVRPTGGVRVMNYATGKRRSLSVDDTTTKIREFPGEDAPGTGHRHFPSVSELELHLAPEAHEMKSSEECYKDFPTFARASCPLSVSNIVPSGQAVMQSPDSGPATGHRRMPMAHEDPPTKQIDPVDSLTPEARLRELQIRRSC